MLKLKANFHFVIAFCIALTIAPALQSAGDDPRMVGIAPIALPDGLITVYAAGSDGLLYSYLLTRQQLSGKTVLAIEDFQKANQEIGPVSPGIQARHDELVWREQGSVVNYDPEGRIKTTLYSSAKLQADLHSDSLAFSDRGLLAVGETGKRAIRLFDTRLSEGPTQLKYIRLRASPEKLAIDRNDILYLSAGKIYRASAGANHSRFLSGALKARGLPEIINDFDIHRGTLYVASKTGVSAYQLDTGSWVIDSECASNIKVSPRNIFWIRCDGKEMIVRNRPVPMTIELAGRRNDNLKILRKLLAYVYLPIVSDQNGDNRDNRDEDPIGTPFTPGPTLEQTAPAGEFRVETALNHFRTKAGLDWSEAQFVSTFSDVLGYLNKSRAKPRKYLEGRFQPGEESLILPALPLREASGWVTVELSGDTTVQQELRARGVVKDGVPRLGRIEDEFVARNAPERGTLEYSIWKLGRPNLRSEIWPLDPCPEQASSSVLRTPSIVESDSLRKVFGLGREIRSRITFDLHRPHLKLLPSGCHSGTSDQPDVHRPGEALLFSELTIAVQNVSEIAALAALLKRKYPKLQTEPDLTLPSALRIPGPFLIPFEPPSSLGDAAQTRFDRLLSSSVGIFDIPSRKLRVDVWVSAQDLETQPIFSRLRSLDDEFFLAYAREDIGTAPQGAASSLDVGTDATETAGNADSLYINPDYLANINHIPPGNLEYNLDEAVIGLIEKASQYLKAGEIRHVSWADDSKPVRSTGCDNLSAKSSGHCNHATYVAALLLGKETRGASGLLASGVLRFIDSDSISSLESGLDLARKDHYNSVFSFSQIVEDDRSRGYSKKLRSAIEGNDRALFVASVGNGTLDGSPVEPNEITVPEDADLLVSLLSDRVLRQRIMALRAF